MAGAIAGTIATGIIDGPDKGVTIRFKATTKHIPRQPIGTRTRDFKDTRYVYQRWFWS